MDIYHFTNNCIYFIFLHNIQVTLSLFERWIVVVYAYLDLLLLFSIYDEKSSILSSVFRRLILKLDIKYLPRTVIITLNIFAIHYLLYARVINEIYVLIRIYRLSNWHYVSVYLPIVAFTYLQKDYWPFRYNASDY